MVVQYSKKDINDYKIMFYFQYYCFVKKTNKRKKKYGHQITFLSAVSRRNKSTNQQYLHKFCLGCTATPLRYKLIPKIFFNYLFKKNYMCTKRRISSITAILGNLQIVSYFSKH